MRLASNEVHAARMDCQDAGFRSGHVIELLRMEHLDWDRYLEQMQESATILDAIGAPTGIELMVLSEKPLATEGELLSLRRDEGYIAYHSGQSVKACIYKKSSGDFKAWTAGWHEARDEDRADNKEDRV